MRRSHAALLAVLVVVAMPTAGSAQSSPETIACFTHFFEYVGAVGRGDLEAAETFWRPADRRAAHRLGITHPHEMLLKIDSDSPLWRIQPGLADSTADVKYGPAMRTEAGPLAGTYTLMLRVYEGARRLRKQYLFLPDDQGGYRLASRARYVAEQGPATSGRHVTVFERRPGRPWTLPPHLLENLDAAVAGMADHLGMSPERRATLEKEKLHYLLAAPGVVEYLAGAPTVGVADLQVDMVITHHPYHVHELAHLLINVWLEEVPLYTLPLLQEGLATHLGGRWGRAPRVLARVGRTSLRTGVVTLDELLTRRDFHGASADLTYAPAGVFAGYLLDAFGADGLRRAYLACSGSLDEVDAWSADEVAARIAGAVGEDWTELVAGFERRLEVDAAARTLAPTPAEAALEGPITTLAMQHLQLEAAEGRDRVRLRLHAEDGPARAAVLFGGGDGPGGENPLLAEQVPGRPYRGETHVLILTPQEAKLYDLRTRTLIGLHSEGFWPGDEYAVDAGATLRLDVAPGVLPPLEAAILLPLSR
ncbi:hypothetical protein GF314_04980 [bacterium]|nr:hypothetical protein [bacterium]